MGALYQVEAEALGFNPSWFQSQVEANGYPWAEACIKLARVHGFPADWVAALHYHLKPLMLPALARLYDDVHDVGLQPFLDGTDAKALFENPIARVLLFRVLEAYGPPLLHWLQDRLLPPDPPTEPPPRPKRKRKR